MTTEEFDNFGTVEQYDNFYTEPALISLTNHIKDYFSNHDATCTVSNVGNDIEITFFYTLGGKDVFSVLYLDLTDGFFKIEKEKSSNIAQNLQLNTDSFIVSLNQEYANIKNAHEKKQRGCRRAQRKSDTL